jgi:acylpyruvate hydrolase
MKIICVGRNYVDHIKELNNNLPVAPVIFMKPDTAIPQNNSEIYLPDFTSNMHHEVELVIKIDKAGKNIEEKFAHKYYSSIGVGIDFTARDIQDHCKENKLPWEIAKAFDNSAPIGNRFIPLNELPEKENINFSLKKNDAIVQQSNSSLMIFSFDKIISYISKYFTLKTGDLIFTGTPAGVSKVEIGDELECFIENISLLKTTIK